MRALTLLLLAVLLVVFGGCALLGDQVHFASTTSCISKTCQSEPDTRGYQRCEAACRSTYGK